MAVEPVLKTAVTILPPRSPPHNGFLAARVGKAEESLGVVRFLGHWRRHQSPVAVLTAQSLGSGLGRVRFSIEDLLARQCIRSMHLGPGAFAPDD